MADGSGIWIEPLHLADANRIILSGIQLTGQSSISAMRNCIRQFLELCGHKAWAIGQSDQVRLIAGIQLIDPLAHRAILHMRTSPAGLDNNLLTAILYKLFFELDIYRVEVTVPASKTEIQTVMNDSGLVLEGKMRCSQLSADGKRHQDVMLYSMLRPEFPGVATAFIPFNRGIFTVSGNCKTIHSADFLHYHSVIKTATLQEQAELLNMLDSSGNLLGKPEIYKLSGEKRYIARSDSPILLQNAAKQIVEYFAGRLTHFDLPLNLECGSEFQQRVWRALSAIPFGSTWTYEELAYHLSPDDWQSARKMARAVGSACGANPLPLILPCHRVIGKDGRLVGFGGGLDMKEYLLDHEIMGLNE